MADSGPKSSSDECARKSGCIVIERVDFPRLIEVLKARGYRVVSPKVHEGAVIYDDLGSVEDLPAGWTDEQDGGKYRLLRRDDQALFGYAVGPLPSSILCSRPFGSSLDSLYNCRFLVLLGCPPLGRGFSRSLYDNHGGVPLCPPWCCP